MTDEPTKRCARCGETKPLNLFGFIRSYSYTPNGAIKARPGPQAYCKACDAAHHREMRAIRRQRRMLHAQTRSYPQT